MVTERSDFARVAAVGKDRKPLTATDDSDGVGQRFRTRHARDKQRARAGLLMFGCINDIATFL